LDAARGASVYPLDGNATNRIIIMKIIDIAFFIPISGMPEAACLASEESGGRETTAPAPRMPGA
jgi:hypothetical protein